MSAAGRPRFAPGPVTLEDAGPRETRVRIEPLDVRHADDLLDLSVDPEAWRLMPHPPPADAAAWREFVAAAQAFPDSVPFAIVDAGRGRAVGTTRFLAIDAAHRRLEIGWTMLAPAARRTHVNTVAKLLLLAHAFEELGAMRVELKTDAANARSRAAMERLGATFEGVFRKHRLRWDGSVRDTAWYSIVDDEWPSVRERLVTLCERPR